MCGLTLEQEMNEYVSCFHPLLALPHGYTEKGKIRYVPMKLDDHLIDFYKNKENMKSWKEKGLDRPIMIPCGRCIGCRLDNSREWALRCMMELKSNNGIAFFLTLTYNEAKGPFTYYGDPDTGEAIPGLTLRLDDLQRFWKRLRKSLPNKKIRYFACGEYGAESWRPHYHAIVFGWMPDDCQVFEVKDTTTYYRSPFLEKIWSNGNVVVTSVDFNTCAYVARYTAKKACTLGDDFYKKFNMEPPFLVMSRRPGIGWKYLEQHKNFYETDKIYVSGSDPVDGKIPRSFIQKAEESDPEIYEHIKKLREVKGSVFECAVVQLAKVPYSKLLADSEAVLLQKSRVLARKKL